MLTPPRWASPGRSNSNHLQSWTGQSNEYINSLKLLKRHGRLHAHSNALCIHRRIETLHVRASTSIRICISIKWWLKLPWVRWLSGLWIVWRSWIRITGTARRIQRWCWQSVDLGQPCRISTQTVTLLNCFSIQRQFIQCLHKQEQVSMNLTIISKKLVNFRHQIWNFIAHLLYLRDIFLIIQ